MGVLRYIRYIFAAIFHHIDINMKLLIIIAVPGPLTFNEIYINNYIIEAFVEHPDL